VRRRRKRRRALIPGPPLLGFADAFDGAYGDPETPRPYPRVTPARVGGALLPFPCPHCGAVRSEAVDARRRLWYLDEERGHSWCPRCRGRYILNTEGAPLPAPLPAGATYAPAAVDRGGPPACEPGLAPEPPEGGLALLGAEAA
jgi:hypothetical protein